MKGEEGRRLVSTLQSKYMYYTTERLVNKDNADITHSRCNKKCPMMINKITSSVDYI